MTGMSRVAQLATRFCRRMFEPRLDVRTADRDVEALLRESWMGRSAASFATKIHGAWLTSRCRWLLRAVVNAGT